MSAPVLYRLASICLSVPSWFCIVHPPCRRRCGSAHGQPNCSPSIDVSKQPVWAGFLPFAACFLEQVNVPLSHQISPIQFNSARSRLRHTAGRLQARSLPWARITQDSESPYPLFRATATKCGLIPRATGSFSIQRTTFSNTWRCRFLVETAPTPAVDGYGIHRSSAEKHRWQC